jgi:hypothetical protein
MKDYTRRLVFSLALLAGAVVIWYLGHRLLDLTGALIDGVGPIWALIIVGFVTVGLGAVWIRYGGAGALGRWGVTIKPALPPDPVWGEPSEGLTGHVPDTQGRPARDDR